MCACVCVCGTMDGKVHSFQEYLMTFTKEEVKKECSLSYLPFSFVIKTTAQLLNLDLVVSVVVVFVFVCAAIVAAAAAVAVAVTVFISECCLRT